MRALALALGVAATLWGARADADCHCVAVAADVAGAIQADVAIADGLYARGDFGGALAAYAKAYASAKAPALLFAQAMAKWQLGATADARALFEAYLKAGGTLVYRDRAEAGLRDVSAGVSATVGAVVGVGGEVGGAVGVVGAVPGVGKVAEKPARVAGGAAVVLGIVAIAAVGAVGIHSIAAGVSDNIDLDPKFDLGLGLTGVVVGVSAIYLYGLTAATGTVAAKCASLPAGKPLVAPIALTGGGGLVAAMSF